MRIAGFKSSDTNQIVFINIEKIVAFERFEDATLIWCGDASFEVVETPEQIIQTLANLSN